MIQVNSIQKISNSWQVWWVRVWGQVCSYISNTPEYSQSYIPGLATWGTGICGCAGTARFSFFCSICLHCMHKDNGCYLPSLKCWTFIELKSIGTMTSHFSDQLLRYSGIEQSKGPTCLKTVVSIALHNTRCLSHALHEHVQLVYTNWNTILPNWMRRWMVP